MTVLADSRLHEARAQTLALVEGFSDEDLEAVHSTLMSPLVWDLGHIAAFEDLWLCHRRGGLELLHGELAEVYDAFETPRAQRGDLPHLRRAGAERYLEEVRARVAELGLEDSDPYVELVARHERQHAETMLQTLALAGLRPSAPARAADEPPVLAPSGLEFVDLPACPAFALGAAATDGFAYDNEKPQHQLEVEAFAIGRVAVTNGDWLAFIDDGGYARREWWSDAGWKWRSAEDAQRPLHWTADGGERALAGLRELDAARPVVHVSAYEADAFARARGVRLPTEVEWELAATFDQAQGVKRAPAEGNLIEESRFATARPSAASATPCGALGMIGDVWEWTSSEFGGYPGFRADPYPEYSEVFFGEGYRVLRGGSFATSALVATPTFRNWDLPGRRQIFAGLRVAAPR
ncbi:MAG TPA: ergothioneine biosynthesis protein EgtB [Solirubrobacteraceae bacterium]|jgi:iron(II)-dependent oxidoreductase|nr:ergothioneine biosynthesis protein EgtB [Solirubrobacteraceae bacterium]